MSTVSQGQRAGVFGVSKRGATERSVLVVSSLSLVLAVAAACSTPDREFTSGAGGSGGASGSNGAGEKSDGGHSGKSTAGSDNSSAAGDGSGGTDMGDGGGGSDGNGDGECPELSAPDDGELAVSGSVATFSCSEGYELAGKAKLTCRADGTWSSEAPTCNIKDCGALSDPSDGIVDAPATTFGETATYACRDGYQLSGADTRSCDKTGSWSASEPACVRNSCAEGLSGADLDCGGVGEDCCARLAVPGGKFNRGNDAGNPATVSAFSLDKFEVTVGRFRAFVNAGFGTKANPPTGADWQATYNDGLEPDTATLIADLEASTENSWSQADDYLPMNNATWYEALAFCIWDGGRLPTTLQWDYAATGGKEQRKYPWGNTNPGTNTALTVYGCFYGSGVNCSDIGHLARVGWSDGDKAKWGQRDMGGSLSEFTRDWTGNYPSLPASCTDCANLTVTQAPQMITMGGDYTSDAARIVSPALGSAVAVFRTYTNGFRCASTP
ncbi:MAG TPA: SUMF1/EgtB/PvdO family nonheme iron enzyme [Polyangiaceae bacterium]|nr:SUMF1/EgtB/PvdO family nonheme iron enzyme [Polyangiaceae bacterium]